MIMFRYKKYLLWDRTCINETSLELNLESSGHPVHRSIILDQNSNFMDEIDPDLSMWIQRSGSNFHWIQQNHDISSD